MTEDFPNLYKDTDIDIQEPQWTLIRINLKKSTLRHTIKLSNVKNRILKETAASNSLPRRETLRDYQLISLQNLARQKGVRWFKQLRERNCQPRILYLPKIPFTYEGEITSQNLKKEMRKFTTTRLSIKKSLMGTLQVGIKTL